MNWEHVQSHRRAVPPTARSTSTLHQQRNSRSRMTLTFEFMPSFSSQG